MTSQDPGLGRLHFPRRKNFKRHSIVKPRSIIGAETWGWNVLYLWIILYRRRVVTSGTSPGGRGFGRTDRVSRSRSVRLNSVSLATNMVHRIDIALFDRRGFRESACVRTYRCASSGSGIKSGQTPTLGLEAVHGNSLPGSLGNRLPNRTLGNPNHSITIRSKPIPPPACGGQPYRNAFT